MTEWMLASMAFAGVLGLAALAAEGVMASLGGARRWVWVAAVAVSVLVPAGALAGVPYPGGLLSGPPSPGVVARMLEERLATGEGASGTAAAEYPAASRLGASLAVAWIICSGLLLAVYLAAWLRFRLLRSRWRRVELCGRAVLLSADAGPAVVGVRHPCIVVPGWVASAPERVQRLILLHEAEHARAGDHLLLAAAPLALVLLPWSVPLWWQFRRLRLAVELDCDDRLLASGVTPREYGRLLLAVAGGSTGLPAGSAALAEPRTFLERRILAMSAPRHRRPLRAMLLAGAATMLALAACETIAPLAPRETTPIGAVVAEPDGAAPAETAAAAPVTGPVTAEPAAGDSAGAAVAPPARAPLLRLAPQRAPGSELPPLLVIDGVVMHGAVLDELLEPADIAAIEVIKGGAAERLYGTRAAGGVISVTSRGAARPVPAPAGATAPADVPRAVAPARAPTGREQVPEATPRRALRVAPPEAASPAPLYVIDGVVADHAALARLSPDLIEHIEVIKGAAAQRLYGSRAAAGVIRVTTKR
jgi:TonB-dependent SusC/RagA subfamily outer membrane receptor